MNDNVIIVVESISKGKEPVMKVEQEKKSAASKETAQTRLFTRQPLSVLSKIAFWAFLVEGLGSLGGAIALMGVSEPWPASVPISHAEVEARGYEDLLVA